VKLADIRIGNRHRHDLGDIEALAGSIREIGLLHPVVVNSDGMLIAGRRRIEACSFLGWTEIPATVLDLDSIIRGEHDENVYRKDFTPSEAVAIAAELEPMEREAAKTRHGRPKNSENFTGFPDAGNALDRVAEAVGMSRPTLTKAREVVEFGDEELIEKMDNKSVEAAHKELRMRELAAERAEIAKAAQDLPVDDRWSVEVADIRSYQTGQRFDFIITDPPYPREYLDLYAVLAQRALEWLKPNGLLVAMCGQSYLDQIMQMMSEHLEYYWAGCYLTPGQPTPLRARQVNTTWKPILIYRLPGATYNGKIFGDVWTSDGNDKEHHKWGQSISGMLALVKQICLPGQTIFDPFCGAGTTGVAALMHGCLFSGIDLDEDNVGITRRRLHDTTKE